MAGWENDGSSLIFSACELVVSLCVSAVLVELVAPSMVNVFGDVVLSDSDHGFVESQTFSLSRKREAPFVEFQEDVNTGGTPKKTPPATRRKIRGIESGDVDRSSVREKSVIENMGHYLDTSQCLEVDIEELECYLLGPDESDVDIRCIALYARGEQQKRLFHTFS